MAVDCGGNIEKDLADRTPNDHYKESHTGVWAAGA
jgi:hypothetical protein